MQEPDPAAFEEMLAGVQEVESDGRLPQVVDRQLRGQGPLVLALVNVEQVEQATVRQLHCNDDVTGDAPDLVEP